MPKWGLTEIQRRTKPWGIDPDLLLPAKTITDPVHGDVFINRLELAFLDSAPMQRLRGVRQLGFAHAVYPGATHTRFAHAMGTLRAAQDLLDAVVDNRFGPHATPDLFGEWEEEGAYDEHLAEATVLARLGALLHDFCHVPYGHTIEDDLKVLEEHDKNEDRFEKLWSQLPADLRSIVTDARHDFFEELQMLILSKKKWEVETSGPGGEPVRRPRRSRYPFVADIVGNTICADLLDYIRRDHHHTGLPLAIGTRFAHDFYVMSRAHAAYPAQMVVRITRAGHRRADIVSELLKYLQYRYELSERVLIHHAKVAGDAMMGKLLEIWHDAEWIDEARRTFPGLVPAGESTEDIDEVRRTVRAREPQGLEKVDAAVRTSIEAEFTSRSDDGLLEHMSDVAAVDTSDHRRRAIGILGGRIRDRDFFKLAGRAEGPSNRAHGARVYRDFGGAGDRRRLEKQAARFAGISPRWNVVLWIPNPDMRLKVAGVLVDEQGWVSPLHEVEPAGTQILRKHKELWAVTVYMPKELQQDPRIGRVAVSFIGQQLGLMMVDHNGDAVPTPDALASERVLTRLKLVGQQAADVQDGITAARGVANFDSLLTVAWETARSLGHTQEPRPDDL